MSRQADGTTMNHTGYILLSRMTAQLRATDVLSNNIANLETPGFRAQRMVFAQALKDQRDAAPVPGGRQVAYAEDRATWRDFQQGRISHTNNPLDVALNGEGFFVVETDKGERYTRAGRFTLSADGQLTDAQGNAVLGDGSRPIAVSANDTRIEITGDGTVKSENGVIGRLAVVRFDNTQSLRAEGENLFATDAPAQPVAQPRVVQGAVETANVNAVTELTKLTGDTRLFQLMVQMSEAESDRGRDSVRRILGHNS